MGAAVGASMPSSAKVGRRIANRGAHPMQPMRWLVDKITQPWRLVGKMQLMRWLVDIIQPWRPARYFDG